MSKLTDARVVAAQLFFIPIQTRVPLKFGSETLTRVTCARVRVELEDRAGRRADGWGETPLSVQWVWPSTLPYERREQCLATFCRRVVARWLAEGALGHPLEVGWDFQEGPLQALLEQEQQGGIAGEETLPRLAALLCCSVVDQAVHDAYGRLHRRPTFATFDRELMNRDLGSFLEPEPDAGLSFHQQWPDAFLVPPPSRLLAWHLVGGLDAVAPEDLRGDEPQDGYPVLLADWIRRDGLRCLKIKLRGNDAGWDLQRLIQVGRLGQSLGVQWLTADFNCTVRKPAYVNDILDRLQTDAPELWSMLVYVEQPFPYDLEQHAIDVTSIARRKPLFLDESAHDWRVVRLGRRLGWNGVALKTCKTLTGAVLSACWAKAHGLQLMVQDLTNPMLAQIAHVQLAAHVGTIRGVETNGMQFYPEASRPEAEVHPGLYRRREGHLDLSTLGPTGLGYRADEIRRTLPREEDLNATA